VSSTPIHTTSRRALAVLTAVVALAAGCSGDDTSGSASTTKARDGSTSSTTADGDVTTRAPLDATPVRLVDLGLDLDSPIDIAVHPRGPSLLIAERGGVIREAVRDGDGYRLSGRKLCVPAGSIADLVLVPAALPDAGVGVFLVETGARGVARTELATTSLRPESTLELDGATAAALGDVALGEQIVRFIELRATAGLCALAAGSCAEALRLTADYIKTRKQFGQPIATFQAVGQRAADAFVDAEGVRLTALQAAWRIDAGLPADAAVATAKIWASQAGARVVRAAQHLHGGVGVDREYALHRHYLQARHFELTLGSAEPQLRTLGGLIAAGAV